MKAGSAHFPTSRPPTETDRAMRLNRCTRGSISLGDRRAALYVLTS